MDKIANQNYLQFYALECTQNGLNLEFFTG